MVDRQMIPEEVAESMIDKILRSIDAGGPAENVQLAGYILEDYLRDRFGEEYAQIHYDKHANAGVCEDCARGLYEEDRMLPPHDAIIQCACGHPTVVPKPKDEYILYEMKIVDDEDARHTWGQAFVIAKDEEEAKDILLNNSDNHVVYSILEDKEEGYGYIQARPVGRVEHTGPKGKWISEYWE